MSINQYDFLIVGSGIYGATFARKAFDCGKKVLVIDKRNHLGGNVFTEDIDGIHVHKYGAHIFHTNQKVVWDFVNRFSEFNRFTNSPIAKYHNEVYSLPFNMYTFNKMWPDVISPYDALRRINAQRSDITKKPKNLEEKAISLVGKDIYNKLIKGYTEKQWGRPCTQLPAFIIERLPVRFNYDNNYFNSLYQGIPIGGYTRMIKNMLNGIEVRLCVDYLKNRDLFENIAKNVIYTGPIDAFFEYCFGPLEYRTLRFETEILDIPNFQGNAVVNYTDNATPYNRIIEHKWFELGTGVTDKTIISKEFSYEWKPGDEPYYPINDNKNRVLYEKYKELADKKENVFFCGRLGEYKYYDMDQVVENALKLSEAIL